MQNLQMQVDFAIIGAQKSGTTSLAYQIGQHPEICFCTQKEPNFFSTSKHWEQEIGQYHSLFKASSGQKLGEASTSYTFLPNYPNTAQRLHTYNPRMKLIYIMRQPVDRIVSNYSHKLIRGRIKYPPEEEVFLNPDYINRSRYAVQLQPYSELFPPQNFLLLVFEEYISSPRGILNTVADFLGISSKEFREVDLSAQNSSVGSHRSNLVGRILKPFAPFLQTSMPRALLANHKYHLDTKPVFSSELRRLIWRFVESDIRQLEGLMGRSLDIWRRMMPESTRSNNP